MNNEDTIVRFILLDESQAIHNLDDEIRNRDLLHIEEKDNLTFNHKGTGCDVLVDDLIEVAVNPHDILKTQELIGSITPTEFRLYFKGSSKNDKELVKGRLFARFSFAAIVTPLETLRSSRDCFRMYYKTPVLFCCGDTNRRDFWMTSIIKAKFCHFAHTSLSKGHMQSTGAVAKKLPQFSNKRERLEQLLKDKTKGDGISREPKANENITNIDIKHIETGRPDLYFNGELVPQAVEKNGITTGPKQAT
ncbi:hypothetical protein BdWA1_001455 [Babesia duncani]|uniref:Uncharacterized protein n=1 Tax=Babesia duncani TaxID=323732 RepID=A0AAD9PP30_9APIC|nr:hypothetical protein BdWA1_001455 [Babesia duncani]